MFVVCFHTGFASFWLSLWSWFWFMMLVSRPSAPCKLHWATPAGHHLQSTVKASAARLSEKQAILGGTRGSVSPVTRHPAHIRFGCFMLLQDWGNVEDNRSQEVLVAATTWQHVSLGAHMTTETINRRINRFWKQRRDNDVNVQLCNLRLVGFPSSPGIPGQSNIGPLVISVWRICSEEPSTVHSTRGIASPPISPSLPWSVPLQAAAESTWTLNNPSILVGACLKDCLIRLAE